MGERDALGQTRGAGAVDDEGGVLAGIDLRPRTSGALITAAVADLREVAELALGIAGVADEDDAVVGDADFAGGLEGDGGEGQLGDDAAGAGVAHLEGELGGRVGRVGGGGGAAGPVRPEQRRRVVHAVRREEPQHVAPPEPPLRPQAPPERRRRVPHLRPRVVSPRVRVRVDLCNARKPTPPGPEGKQRRLTFFVLGEHCGGSRVCVCVCICGLALPVWPFTHLCHRGKSCLPVRTGTPIDLPRGSEDPGAAT